MRLVSTQFSLETESFELYIAGCREHPCIGCYSPELWDENVGEELNEEKYKKLGKSILSKLDIIKNIFILGGEPLEKPKEEVIKLLTFLKQFKKPLWLFTRFKLKEVDKEILNELDYVKTGRYIKRKKTNKKIRFGIKLASSNQNIYKNF